MTCATFGTVTGGLIGGPMANFLMKRHKIKGNSWESAGNDTPVDYTNPPTDITSKLITTESFINSLALIAVSIFLGVMVSNYMQRFSFTLPTFVWCLFFGIFFRNFLSFTSLFQVFDREIDIIGNVCLSLFFLMNIILIYYLAVQLIVLITIMVMFFMVG